MILELCANGFESAFIAQEAGLDRIELCENLSIGGITPSKKLIEKVVNELSIPTHVLIRPRAGNFSYTQEEIAAMIEGIQFCKAIGCAGIVSGILTPKKTIAIAETQELIEASEGMEFTFHRAFDVCENPLQEISTLKKLRITRLLSSGQAVTAIQGIDTLIKLQQKIEGVFQLMPGGGITSSNVLQFQEQGFEMVHFSAVPKTNATQTLFNNEVVGVSDSKEVHKIKSMVS